MLTLLSCCSLMDALVTASVALRTANAKLIIFIVVIIVVYLLFETVFLVYFFMLYGIYVFCDRNT